MKVFLIILLVLVIIIALILSLAAEFTVVYDNGWQTKIRVLFIEKDIELSKILSFLLFPEKAAQEVSEEIKEEKEKKAAKKQAAKKSSLEKKETVKKESSQTAADVNSDEQKNDNLPDAPQQEQKPNFIKKLYDKEGIVGILLIVSNLLQSAGSAVSTLFKNLHIYSLYVKIIVGGSDAADIADTYGTICGAYYPIKGIILNGMKIDQYDDYIQPDFIAPRTEVEFQIIAAISVGLLVKVALSAVKVFLINLIKNK